MSDEKNKYITAYGSSNEDSYGRGDVTNISTKYNMLTTNPLLDENAPEMNSYSSDGSYNQDIFGWKCFNSPVSFRNGIYGECGYVTTFSDNDFHGIKIATYNIDDNDNQSKIIIKADNIELDGDVGNLEVKHAESADSASSISYNNTTVIKTTSATYIIPNTNGNINLGSSSYKFKNIYGDIKLGTSLSICTRYAITGAVAPEESVSSTVTTDLSNYDITIDLPKCTYITTKVDNNVNYVGYGATSSDIGLPNGQNTYLAVNRIVPYSTTVANNCIGTDKRHYDHIWSNNLHGVIPHPVSDRSNKLTSQIYPVGCIIKAIAQLGAFTEDTSSHGFKAGKQNINSNTFYIREAAWSPTGQNWQTGDSSVNLNSTPSNDDAMKWVALSGVTSLNTISRETPCEVLIMRIE